MKMTLGILRFYANSPMWLLLSVVVFFCSALSLTKG